MEGSTICDWGSAVVLWEVGFVPSLLLRCPAYFPSLADSILSTSPHSCFLSAQLPQKQKVDSLKDPSSLLLPTLASCLLSCHRSRRWTLSKTHPLYFSPLLLPFCSAATEAEGGSLKDPTARPYSPLLPSKVV